MGSNRSPYYNASGYPDPTAFNALKPIIQEEAELDKKVHTLVHVVKFIVDAAGFTLTARIQLKDKRTGKEFR